jgi:hypothetical protein
VEELNGIETLNEGVYFLEKNEIFTPHHGSVTSTVIQVFGRKFHY